MKPRGSMENTALSAPSAAVDFLVIGAQKSGTTAFFKYLTEHPQVFMPAEKEVEFFQNDRKFSRGRDWYYDTYFAKAPESKVKGEASTHYMMYSSVPERIHSFYPGVKLIAVLRDPVERAYSHYRMAVRRGIETRSFRECVVDGIKKGVRPDSEVCHNSDYIMFGEYGRILQNYLEWFSKEQLLVIFSEELVREPRAGMARTYRFLGVADDFVPGNLGKKYHVSGEQRIPGLAEWVRRNVGALKRNRLGRKLLRRVNTEAFIFWLETELNVKAKKSEVPADAAAQLVKHYARDVALLEKLLGARVPWPAFRGR